MSDTMKGHCLCGGITIEAQGAPAMAVNCHCTDCQRSTGSGHASIAGFPEAVVALTGTPKAFTVKGDSGNEVTRFFCPDCGSPLYSEVQAMPGMQFFKLGLFDNSDAIMPAMVFYTKSAHAWDRPAEGIPSFEEMPG